MKTGSDECGITANAAVESAPPLNDRACLPEEERRIGSMAPPIEVTLILEMIFVASINLSETCQPMLRLSPTNGSVFRRATNAILSG
jgi:hypothetical protein